MIMANRSKNDPYSIFAGSIDAAVQHFRSTLMERSTSIKTIDLHIQDYDRNRKDVMSSLRRWRRRKLFTLSSAIFQMLWLRVQLVFLNVISPILFVIGYLMLIIKNLIIVAVLLGAAALVCYLVFLSLKGVVMLVIAGFSS